MHPALRISELVDIIATFLADDASLFALARTCRALSGAALDCLWKTQTTLDNLVKCLPADAWREGSGSRLRVTRDFTSKDWTVALEYSRRLAFSPDNIPCVSILQAISAFGSATLFPRLHGFKCPAVDTIHPLETAFLLPRIRRLQLVDISFDAFDVIASSELRLGMLTELALVSKSAGAVPDRLWTIADSLQVVEHLVLNHIPDAILRRLSELPKLAYLRLETPIEDATNYTLCFPALHALDLITTSAEYATHFVERLPQSCRLRWLMLQILPSPAEEIASLYTTVADRISTRTLRYLGVDTVTADEETIMPYPLPRPQLADFVVESSALKPLLRFSHLRWLTLQPPVGFDLHEEMAWAMARAWPKLTHLQLGAASRARPIQPTLPISALAAFAEYTPHLQTLLVDVDALHASPCAHVTHLQRALEVVYFGVSPIVDTRGVVVLPQTIFPSVRVNTPGDWEWDEMIRRMGQGLDAFGSLGRVYRGRWQDDADVLCETKPKKTISSVPTKTGE
uniref:F-box domain-containing protein n=1 Tax=Mycena chlorophos TaxID=658473 RepID=A0ABQ0L009_MYCCL|nr:predicted protein [Mycena chlorophos]